MADWLRPFGRNKTPLISCQVSPERQATPSIDESVEGDEAASAKIRSTSRVSSFMGMGLRTGTPLAFTPDVFQGIRELESAYHKPSSDQMAETLQVVMMSHSLLEPLPIQYNSMILHVLESYYDLRQQLDAKQDTIEGLERNHTKRIQEFEEVADRWAAKEKAYKDDLRAVEILLSRKEGGFEEVSLARANSRVKAAEEIECKLKTEHADRVSKDTVEEVGDRATTLLANSSQTPRHSCSETQMPSLVQPQLTYGVFKNFLDSATEESIIGLGIGIDHHEKSLLDISTNYRKNGAQDNELLQPQQIGNTSFSYQPSDDEELSVCAESYKFARKPEPDEYSRSRRHTIQHRVSRMTLKEATMQPKARTSSKIPETQSRGGSTLPSLPCKDADLLLRGNSTSSVLTAIRDTSGRSSVMSSQRGWQEGLELKQTGSSSEAIAAAVAASNKSREAENPK